MHPSTLPDGHAIGVTTEGIIQVKENDVVIVGVKCWVDKDGKVVPFNENFQMFRNELNNNLGKDVYLFKRVNLKKDENSTGS